MSFDPEVVIATLQASLENSADSSAFRKEWLSNVEARVGSWTAARQGHQSLRADQLTWESHVVEYVNYVSGSKKAVPYGQPKKSGRTCLPPNVPLWGPVFHPPTFRDMLHRQSAYSLRDSKTGKLADITPKQAYIRPITVIHPYYFGGLRRCPRNKSHHIISDGWQSNGSREIHGLYHEETAIGFQLRCNDCKGKTGSDGRPLTYCFSLVNSEFWDELNVDYRTFSRDIPHFFHKCAVTRELFDLIVELRPSTSALGLATHIEQLHLLHYHSKRLEYLDFVEELTEIKGQTMLSFGTSLTIAAFSPPLDPDGYADTSISNDVLTEVYLHFGALRLVESAKYLRTLEAVTLSFDHTFRITRKATLVNRDGGREAVWKGGMFSAVNERNEIVLYVCDTIIPVRFCQSGANDDFGESLAGLRRRFELLGTPLDLTVVADNCCSVAGAVEKNLPEAFLGLDLKHFKGRYEAVIAGGVHNRYRSAVLHDIVHAILERPAENGQPAIWRNKEDQIKRLEATYQKWLGHGGVWSDAAAKAHAVQMGHVRKGCLTRPRNDVRSDGSRIEGSHKGWNSLQRANPSGYEGIMNLAGDHVLRRNVRVIYNSKEFKSPPFLKSTFGSHHVSVVDNIARRWNGLLERHNPKTASGAVTRFSNHSALQYLPLLVDVASGETFGAVASRHAITFGGLLKLEDVEEPELQTIEEFDEVKREEFLREMNIDPQLACTYETKVYVPIDPTLLDAQDQVLAGNTESTSPSSRATKAELLDLTVDEVLAVGAVAGSMGKNIEVTRASIVDLTHDDSDGVVQLEPAGNKRKAEELPSHQSEPVSLPPVKRTRIVALGSAESQPKGNQGSGAKKLHQFFAIHSRPSAASTSGDVSSSQAAAVVKTTGAHSISRASTVDRSSTPSIFGSSPSPVKFISNNTSTVVSESVAALSEQLPLPTLPGDTRQLTRSGRLFKSHTGIDPTALKIEGNDEYMVFMQEREKHQWASYRMTSSAYVDAARIYNEALEEFLHNKPGRRPALKSPRAIMEELGRTEAMVLDRLAKQDFVSKGSGSTQFWYHHCYAVNLVESTTNSEKTRKRRNAVCTRCRSVMFPGPEESSTNHKRGLCSDGVPTHMQNLKYEDGKTAPDHSPPWPQPDGIFTKENRTHRFNPLQFLKTLRLMYEKVVVQNDAGSLGMEYHAFVDMLQERVVRVNDSDVLFRLYPQLQVPPTTPQVLFQEHDGVRYLKIDCLRDD